MERTRNWLARRSRWLWPTVTAIAVAVAVMTIVDAQTGGGGRDRDRDGWRGHDNECAELAALAGTDCDGLKAGIAEGQTLAEIAAANGVERQTLIDAITAEINAEIDEAVADGKLTDAQAERLREGVVDKVTAMVDGSGEHRGHGGRHGKKGDRDRFAAECDELAELVGAADCAGLKAALADDQTLAQIAESNDIEPQTVIDALVAEANAEIDTKVEAGRLTEARAETIRERLNERISDFVNNGFERSEHGRRGMHGKRGGLRW